MFDIIKKWFAKYFSEPESAILLLVLLLGFFVIIFFGSIMAPFLAALVLAYLLETAAKFMQRFMHMPRWLAISIIYVVFIGFFILAIIGLLPLLSKQFTQLLAEWPRMWAAFHEYLLTLPQKYPNLASERAIRDLINSTQFSPDKIAGLSKTLFSISIASASNVITVLVYLFLVPLLTLFFLKDKNKLIAWCMQFVPGNRGLVIQVWQEMRQQVGNYIRGKFLEVIIVGGATYIGFQVFGLNYAPLLGTIVGLSVLVPYVGMVVVTIPVIVVGLLQWGPSSLFAWMFMVYLIIQFIDGNILVPLLFSEAVNIHPVAIIAAVLFFGGIWGFWGVFFAIPLATLVRAAINAWAAHATRIHIREKLPETV